MTTERVETTKAAGGGIKAEARPWARLAFSSTVLLLADVAFDGFSLFSPSLKKNCKIQSTRVLFSKSRR